MRSAHSSLCCHCCHHTRCACAPAQDVRAANRAQFELELEFVQALANPFYLYTLAQQNVLTQPAFINYLHYLQYWKEKEYARFILYPHALHHLDLLQHASFRKEIGTEAWRQRLHDIQFEHWGTWRDDPARIRTRILGQPPIQPSAEKEKEPESPSAAGSAQK